MAPQFRITAASTAKRPRILAVDQGAVFCLQENLEADVLLGDLDSLPEEALERTKVWERCERLRYPERKDATDGELALRFLTAKGVSSALILAGFAAERPDHVLMNIQLVQDSRKRGMRILLTDGERLLIPLLGAENYHFVFPYEAFGRLVVSVKAMGEGLQGLTYKGLSYPLKAACLPAHSSLGLSNYPAAYDAASPQTADFEIQTSGGEGLLIFSPQD